MDTLERIREANDYDETTIPLAHLHMEFLFRCFDAMRKIAIEHRGEWDSSACDAEFERRMRG